MENITKEQEKKENIFRDLTEKEEQEFRNFVDEDEVTKNFIQTAKLWHPVIRDEICKRLKE